MLLPGVQGKLSHTLVKRIKKCFITKPEVLKFQPRKHFQALSFAIDCVSLLHKYKEALKMKLQ